MFPAAIFFAEVIDLPPIDLSSGDWWVLLIVQLLQWWYLNRRIRANGNGSRSTGATRR